VSSHNQPVQAIVSVKADKLLSASRSGCAAGVTAPYPVVMPGPEVSPVPRSRPAEDAGEQQTLTELLDFLRATVVNKVAGLSDQQARAASVPPSTLTPAGLVKHLTAVERFWFSIDFAGLDLPHPWTEADPHGAFPLEEGERLVDLVASYQAECQRSRTIVAAASLEDRARGEDMTFTLRYALAHMIEETARHCGHLDLLREALDGETGE
jgi:hypothetical protein